MSCPESPRDRVAYSPIITRPRLRWPGGARVAVWVAPNVEHYELMPPSSPHQNVWPRVAHHPDVRMYSQRDYGNRVGFWRLAELFDEFDVPATVSLNVAVLDRYPEIAEAMTSRGWALMAHGTYNTRLLYGMSLEQERAFFSEMINTVRRHTERPLKGLLGPMISGTRHTPDILAELGFTYHSDWIHDDQPVPIRVRNGRLVSVPYTFELNDAPLFRGAFDGNDYEVACKAQFDRLWAEGEATGMVLCLAVHTFLMGQPHLIGHLRSVLEHVTSHDGVWLTTADAIAEHYLAECYDAVLASATTSTRGSSDAR